MSSYPTLQLDSPIVLGIDSSTKTGISLASVKDGKVSLLHVCTITYPKLRGWERLIKMQGALISILHEHHPTFVLIEGYGYANKHSLVPLVEIGTLIRRIVLEEFRIPMATIAPKALKQYTTGTGNADKKAMRPVVKERWGFDSPDDNQVDAVALSVAGLAYLNAISCNVKEQAILSLISLLHCSNVFLAPNPAHTKEG